MRQGCQLQACDNVTSVVLFGQLLSKYESLDLNKEEKIKKPHPSPRKRYDAIGKDTKNRVPERDLATLRRPPICWTMLRDKNKPKPLP